MKPETIAVFRKHARWMREVKRALGEDLLALCGPTAPDEEPTTEELQQIRRVGLKIYKQVYKWEGKPFPYEQYFKEQGRLRRAVPEVNKATEIYPPFTFDDLKQALADARERVQQ